MTENEWLICEDAASMFDNVWEQEPFVSLASKFTRGSTDEEWQSNLEVEKPLYRFYLASCRNIWQLLPQEESRKGVELAEEFVAGNISWEKVSDYNYYTEGAAFNIDYDVEPKQIEKWVKEVESVSGKTFQGLLSSERAYSELGPRGILLDAAYFADHAMMYPCLTPKGPPHKHTHFMFAGLLREYIDYPSKKS